MTTEIALIHGPATIQWTIVFKDSLLPYRQNGFFYLFLKKADAEAYLADLKKEDLMVKEFEVDTE